MVTKVCPSREILMEYSLGFLSGEDRDNLDSHLESCPDCQTAIMALDETNDRVLGLLRMPLGDQSLLTEPQLQDAMTAAMAIPARMRSLTQGSSLARRLASDMPEALGEYRVLEELGRGGMGRVYKALHTKLDRVVAVKVLSRGCGHDQTAIARFEHEMKAVGRVVHPNIVHAFDAREIDGTLVLIMEFVDGLDTAEIVHRLGSLSVADACELARQTALALECARQHGLVHRDVKPSNIMLARSGEVKLLDLGLARLYAQDSPDGSERSVSEAITATGQAIGTADYMAPEQASDSGTVDIRADVYSLGCTLYKLLCGQAPFGGSGYRTTLDKLYAHVHHPAPSIRRLSPGVPEKVAAILNRLLAKNPGDRFSTPAELAEALAPWCAGADLPALSRRALEAERKPEVAGDLELQTPGTTETVAKPPLLLASWGWKWLTAQLVLLLMAGGLGVALGIVIRIQKDGKETVVEIPDGSTARVTADGQLGVTLPPQAKGPQAGAKEPASSSPLAQAWALIGPWSVMDIQKGKNADAVWNEIFPDGRQDDNFATFDRLTFDDRGGVTFSNLRTGWNGRLAANVDPTATPRVMNLAPASQAGNGAKDPFMLGVYELEGNRLKVRWTKFLPWMASGQRPMDFTIDANSADLSLVVVRPYRERALQGVWSAVSRVEDGKEIPSPDLGIFLRDAASDLTEILELNPSEERQSRVLRQGRCVLNMWKDPKWITVYSIGSADKTVKRQDLNGICKLDGKQLHLAYRISGPRPAEFASKPGSGVTLLALERAKPETATNLPDPTKSGKRAIAAIEELGGAVVVDPNTPDKAVTSVALSQWFVSDADVEYLQRFPRLRQLDLSHTQVTDAALKYIQGLTALESLNLTNTRVTDAGLKQLRGLTELQTLHLKGTGATDAALEGVRGLEKLVSLDLRDTKVTNAGLKRLTRLTQLQTLYLGNTAVSDGGLENLKSLPNLQGLDLTKIGLTDAGLVYLQPLPKLRSLYLGGTAVTDAGLERLKSLTSLLALDLYGTKITDAGLEHLQGLPKLQTLYLWRTAVTDAGLEHLKGLTGLRTLYLEHTKVTDEGRMNLRRAMPNCRIVN